MAKRVSKTSGLTAGDSAVLVQVMQDNADAVADAINSQVAAAMEAIGLLAEGYAKRACPVDTGRLRNSITHQVGHVGRAVTSAYVGTNVEYAPHVELGTRRQAAQPFLRPAAQDHGSRYRQVLQSYLGG